MSIDTKYNANDYKKLFHLKKGYPEDVKHAISVYAVDKKTNKARVMGSFSYRSGNASDIDLFEEVNYPDKNMLIRIFIDGIRKVTRDLSDREKFYFIEVKAGLDHLYYDVNYGSCAYDRYYVSDNFFTMMELYYSKGFLNDEEMALLDSIHKTTKRTQLQYEKVKDLLRKRYIIRWTSEEIHKGYVILQSFEGEYKYTLEMAVQEKSNINIEGIFINDDNKYVDCSNFLVLSYVSKYGATKHLNFSDEDYEDFSNFRQQSLKESMYTLLYSKTMPNPFKAIKRMLSLAISIKDVDLATRSYKLINTQYGKLYTLNSQLKTLSKVLQIHGEKKIYMDVFFHHIDYIRWELENLIFLDFDFHAVLSSLNAILSNKLSHEKIIDELDKNTHIISSYISKKTYKLLTSAGLYPLPKDLIPEKKPF
jgi:hypothetical protein